MHSTEAATQSESELKACEPDDVTEAEGGRAIAAASAARLRVWSMVCRERKVSQTVVNLRIDRSMIIRLSHSIEDEIMCHIVSTAEPIVEIQAGSGNVENDVAIDGHGFCEGHSDC